MPGRGQAVVFLVRAGVLRLGLKLQPTGFVEFLQLQIDLLMLGVPEITEAILEAFDQVITAAGLAFQQDKNGVLEGHGQASQGRQRRAAQYTGYAISCISRESRTTMQTIA